MMPSGWMPMSTFACFSKRETQRGDPSARLLIASSIQHQCNTDLSGWFRHCLNVLQLWGDGQASAQATLRTTWTTAIFQQCDIFEYVRHCADRCHATFCEYRPCGRHHAPTIPPLPTGPMLVRRASALVRPNTLREYQ